MTDPLPRLLDAINIDPNRHYIEFQFSDEGGQRETIQIDFDYLESLAGVLRQAFISAVMDGRHGGIRQVAEDFISVPRVDVDQPVNIGVDMMTGNIIAMLLFGSPFQSCYSMPVEIARNLARDILSVCETLPDITADQRPN